MGTRVPIRIPPGRKSVTPNLALVYSSSGGPSPYGYGWDLPLGHISRSTKWGVPGCNGAHTDDFILSMPSGTVELIAETAGQDYYRPKVEEAYLRAQKSTGSNFWVVYDRSGLKYVFGDQAAARTGNDTSQFTTTVSWALTHIEDPNGNAVDISYASAYTTTDNVTYPAEIKYGGNATLGSSHFYHVTFAYENRPDPIENDLLGARAILQHRLTTITVTTDIPSSNTPIRSYTLTYDDPQNQPAGYQSRLNSVQALDSAQHNEYPLPTKLAYADSTAGFTALPSQPYTPPAGVNALRTLDSSGNLTQTLLDMNGDGIVDIVQAGAPNWKVYFGSQNGWQASVTWPVPAGAPTSTIRNVSQNCKRSTSGSEYWSCTYTDTFDINGDGLPDFIDANPSLNPDGGGSSHWNVYLGTSTGFSSSPITWPVPTQGNYLTPIQLEDHAPPYDTHGSRKVAALQDVIDMNGDGRPDLVVVNSAANYSSDYGCIDPRNQPRINTNIPPCNGLVKAYGPYQWTVYYNTGSGFDLAHPAVITTAPYQPLRLRYDLWYGVSLAYSDLIDFNGDGLPDVVATYDIYMYSNSNGDGGWSVISDNNTLSPYCTLPTTLPDGSPMPNGSSAGCLLVFSNTGRGFSSSPNYMIAGNDVTSALHYDVNGDGLPDVVNDLVLSGPDDTVYVQLNQGGTLEPPQYTDGLVGDKVAVGRQWAIGTGSKGPIQSRDGNGNYSVDLIDFNGDGMLDRVDTTTSPWTIQLNANPVRPNLLRTMQNGLGGTTLIDYDPSTSFDNTGGDGIPDLPFVTWVTTGMLAEDGLCTSTDFDLANSPCLVGYGPYSHALYSQYRYAGGLFDRGSREFRGFQDVWVGDAADNLAGDAGYNWTHTIFLQDDTLKGNVSAVYTCAGDSNCTGTSTQLVRSEVNTWNSGALSGTQSTQLWLGEHDTTTYDLNAPTPHVLKEFNDPPDAYGNVTHTYSSDGSGGDRTDTYVDYAQASGTEVHDKPEHTKSQVGTGGTPFAEKWFYYDGGTYGQVQKGNLTKVETWLDASWAAMPANCRQNSAKACVTTTMTYDSYGNITDAYDANANHTKAIYDSRSLYPYQVTNAAGQTTTTVMDYRWGKPLSVTDPNQAQTIYTYDNAGRLATVKLPLETAAYSTKYTYTYASQAGQLSWVQVQQREPNQLGSSFAGTSVAQVPGYVTSTKYLDALGRDRHSATLRVVDGTDTLVVSGRTDYDRAGRTAAVYDPYPNTSGDPSSPSTPTNGVTTYDYVLNGNTNSWSDPLARVHVVHKVDGTSVTTNYNGVNRTDINEAGDYTISTVNAHGKVTDKQTYYGSGTLYASMHYTYDGAGRLKTTMQNSIANTTITIWYDSLGRKIQMVDPDSGTWKYGYDAAGNLIYEDDPKFGQHTQFMYDVLNRVLKKIYLTYPTTAPATYCDLQWSSPCTAYWSDQIFYLYDSNGDCTDLDSPSAGNISVGRLHRVDDPSGSTCFTYDSRGRTTSVTKTVTTNGSPRTAKTSFTYDLADHVQSTTYPDNEQVVTCYNGNGNARRLATNTACSTPVYASSITYDIFGRVDLLTHDNGVSDHRTFYDPPGSGSFPKGHRLSRLWSEKAGTSYLDLSYPGYNLRGQLTGITDNRSPTGALSDTASFTYDLDRLNTVTNSPNLNATYGYDALGNMTLKEGVTLGYSTTQPHTLTTVGGVAVPTPDANGNRTGKPNQSYGYDPDDHLNNINNGAVQFIYDYTGQRVAKIAGGTVTRYYNQLAEVTDTWLTKYYYAGGMLVASRRVAAPVQLVALPNIPAVEVASLATSHIPAVVVLLRRDVQRGVLLAIVVIGTGLLVAPWRRKRVVGIAVRHGHVVLVLLTFSIGSLPIPLLVRPASAKKAPPASTPAPDSAPAMDPAAAPSMDGDGSPAQVPSDPARFSLPADAVEIVNKRTLTAKHFRRADGSFTAVFAAGPLHYHAPDGSLQDLDLTFHADGNDQVVDGTDAVRVRIPGNGNHIEVTDPAGNGVRWLTPQHLAVGGNQAQHTDAQRVRWTYTVVPSGVKQTATITGARGAQTYTFTYQLVGDQPDFTIDEQGNAVAGTLLVPRPVIQRADGISEPAGSWRLAGGPRLQFDYDDSALPATAFPYVIDPTTTAFTVTASADDAWVEGFGNVYPPACSSYMSTSNYAINHSYWSDSRKYAIDYILARWDTSSLGAAATVNSAALVTYMIAKSNPNNRNWQGDWYTWAPPISCSAYVTTVPSPTAFSVSINSLALNALNTVPNLYNAAQYVNKTGFTSIRLAVDGSTPPTGQNYVRFNTYDSGTNVEQLQVDYTLGLTATNSGWWDNTGYHSSTNPNYVVGTYNTTQYHNFLVFDLTGVTNHVTAASLQLTNPAGGYLGDATETYTLFDVSTPISSLTASGSGQVGIFNDLGSGTSYGSRVVSAAANGTTIEIALNAAGVAAINAAAGGKIALGGALTGLQFTNPAQLFRSSGSGVKQLVLTLGSAPSPGCGMALWADNPTAEFHLGESAGPVALDATGHNNNGDYSQSGVSYGQPSLTTDPSTAVSFSAGSVSIPNAPATLTAYTVEAWIKPAAIRAENILARTDASGPSHAWPVQLRINASGKLEHYLWDGSAKVVTGTTVLQAGRVYHVVGTAANGGQMHLYVNGSEQGTPVSVGTMAQGARWVLADEATNGEDFGDFSGTMDEVAIYATQLSSTRISAHYSACLISVPTPTPASTTPTPTPTVMGGGSASGVLHYHTNHLGSVALITNSAGAIYEQIRYKPYGEERGHYDASGNLQPINTCGDDGYCREFTQYDTEPISGLEYAGARFYDPALGMFLTHDPVRSAASPYGYCGGDPINQTDPNGECPWCLIAFIAAFMTFVEVGHQTGDTKTALIAGAIAGVTAGVGGAAMEAVMAADPPVLSAMGKFAVELAAVGAGGYATYESASHGMQGAAALAALGTVLAAYGAYQDIMGAQPVEAGGVSREDMEQLYGAKIEPAQANGAVPVSVRQQGNSVVIQYSDGTVEVRSGGSISWRTNNPGNLNQGPFAQSQGSIGSYTGPQNTFAVFPNEGAGSAALVTRLQTPPYSGYTLDQAIDVFAPPAYNPTAQYQAFVSNALGVGGSTTLGGLTPQQIGNLAAAIRRFEGWSPGTVTYP
jgi:RHS repeat-associated protein